MDSSQLSRRERQIMDCVYARGDASVLQMQEDLPDAPSTMAIRRMVSILEEKGFLTRQKQGREYFYSSKQPRKRVGSKALQHVIDTFFEGSLESALGTHLAKPGTKLSHDELKSLSRLINEAKQRGE